MSTLTNNTENQTINKIAEHYAEIIKLIGEDLDREGLVKTPMRAAKALYYATSGYRSDEDAVVNEAVFTHDGSRMIIVKDIEFYSFCEHHILPFFGTISVGYIPDGKIIGLSKVARLVNIYARRLQVQERLTEQVCQTLMQRLNAKGVIVACNAQHLCMKMRGVEKQDSSTTTTAYSGVFESDRNLRSEFFEALKV
ncbi:MAG: GTP cyclohydrolase I FolE [Muribaculaceae bacterium]|nr:GTP cyclohydrolase I FolE [Muribaculaceae bacterium]MDE5968126.1 GTP cyclohydrolase I FolE [Muribaculaceae bacterium]MDE7393448.1 GTP cyclohydrolase I FolE [Muribaculaceae bacterium]